MGKILQLRMLLVALEHWNVHSSGLNPLDLSLSFIYIYIYIMIILNSPVCFNKTSFAHAPH